MEFVFLAVLLLFSVAFHLLIKLKAEQSLFFSVCLVFAVMFLSGLAANLSVGWYIIIGLCAACLAYVIYKSFKKQIKLLEIVTPGTVIFVIGFCVYFLSTRGALLHLWDEATHWGPRPKNALFKRTLDIRPPDHWPSPFQPTDAQTHGI